MEDFWKTLGKNCINCSFFDGYDLCLHPENEGTINNDSIKKCPIYDNKQTFSNGKITKEEIEHYITFNDQLDDFSYKIFKYVKNNFINLLEFKNHSTYENFRIDVNDLIIKYFDYHYDIYETDDLLIPLEYVYNDTWKKYIEKLEEERLDKLFEKQKQEEEYQKEQELKLLKKLKEKYE